MAGNSGLILRGFRRLIRALSSAHAKREVREGQVRAMHRVVEFLRADVISYIDSEKHGVPNSPLTVLVKGSSRPLVDHGDLRQGITTAVETEGDRVVGAVGTLKRRTRGRGGRFRSFSNVAAALHEGFTIRVTPAVRAAVFAEMRRRRGRRRPVEIASGEGARTWRVKGRPFIKDPLDAAAERIFAELGDAVERTLRGL